MRYTRSIILGTLACIMAVALYVTMVNHQKRPVPAAQHVQSAETVTPTASDTTTPVVTTTEQQAPPSPAPAPAPVTPVSTPIFQASNTDYPQTGHFNLPDFTTTADWSATYSYKCSRDYVRMTAVFGAISEPLGYSTTPPATSDSRTSGQFGYHSAHFAIYVPDGASCTWNITVN